VTPIPTMASGPPRSVLITGCNRGIGLELVKQFLCHPTPPEVLIATCRNPDKADDLQALVKSHPDRLKILPLEMTDYDSFESSFVDRVSEAVGGREKGLNLLINNAGVLPSNKTLESVTPADMTNAFETNCVGPTFLTRALLPLLKTAAGSKGGESGSAEGMSVGRAAAIQMSTAVASVAENTGGKNYAYRVSKTGLNMAMKCLSIDLEEHGILVMSMHPGWVLTEMGGPNALIDTETCAKTMLETLYALTEKDHGSFLRYNNTPIQW